MIKPANYDTTKPAHVLTKPRRGFYIFEILNAEEKMTKATEDKPSRPMLVLHLDIADGPCKGYFMKKWHSDKKYNEDKAFYRCIHRRVSEDVERLKADIESIEKSNPGYKYDWDEKSLIGKRVGGAIGEYEYASRNGVGTDIELRYILSTPRVLSGELDTPPTKKLRQNYQDQGSSDYMDEPLPEYDGPEEQLPF